MRDQPGGRALLMAGVGLALGQAESASIRTRVAGELLGPPLDGPPLVFFVRPRVLRAFVASAGF